MTTNEARLVMACVLVAPTIVFDASVSALPFETLDQVREALLAAPATADNHEARCELLAELDRFLEEPNSERSDTVAQYYRDMIDHALGEIEVTQVREGVAVWKLYSSAMIVKTPTTVFGIDLDEGPNSDSGPPDEVAGMSGITLHMTAEQRARLAQLVDVSFHTHRHHDHVNYQITEALIEAGKSVIVPQDIVDMWARAPFASKFTVLDPSPGKRHRVGELSVGVFAGRQWMAADHSKLCPCNAYLVTIDSGVTALFKGDTNDGADILPWVEDLKKRGVRVDLYVGSLGFWSGEDALPDILRTFDPFLIPGHEYEFTHRKPGEQGSGTASYGSLCARFKPALERGKAVVLSWGERFHYVPSLHREAKSPLTWLELNPEPRKTEVKAGETFTVSFNAEAGGVAIKRWYLAFRKTGELANLPGFDERDWGGIIHDADKDGIFEISTEGWPPGTYVLHCTVDDWPDGSTRTTEPIEVTVLPADD